MRGGFVPIGIDDHAGGSAGGVGCSRTFAFGRGAVDFAFRFRFGIAVLAPAAWLEAFACPPTAAAAAAWLEAIDFGFDAIDFDVAFNNGFGFGLAVLALAAWLEALACPPTTAAAAAWLEAIDSGGESGESSSNM